MCIFIKPKRCVKFFVIYYIAIIIFVPQNRSLLIIPRSISLDTGSNATGSSQQQQQQNAETAREVKQHENLAADWWNNNGPMAALHALNEIRLAADISKKFI